MLITKTSRDTYQFSTEFFQADGGVAFPDFASARRFASRMSEHRPQPVAASDLYAMQLIDEALRMLVRDFDVEIAKASAIGKPIVRSVLEGMSPDVEQDRAYLARAASIDLRLDTGRVVEMREVPTRHGEIESPVLSVGRTRGELVVPWGTTRVAAAWATGAELQLVLVTASGE